MGCSVLFRHDGRQLADFPSDLPIIWPLVGSPLVYTLLLLQMIFGWPTIKYIFDSPKGHYYAK